MAALALDLLVVGLLIGTMVYAAILNRRLAALRGDREAMCTLIAEFGAAADRAREATEALHALGNDTASRLDLLNREASALGDTLDVLSKRGDAVAARLDGALARAGSLLQGDGAMAMERSGRGSHSVARNAGRTASSEDSSRRKREEALSSGAATSSSATSSDTVAGLPRTGKARPSGSRSADQVPLGDSLRRILEQAR